MVRALGPVTLALGACALVASVAGGWLSIRVARRAGVLDHPTDRSSHTAPTPRVGGVPIVASILLALGVWVPIAAGEDFLLNGIPPTVGFALAMSILGLRDDVSSLSSSFRFVVQICCAVFFLWGCYRFVPGVVAQGPKTHRVLLLVVATVWIVWMVNLYNFMDGIDGLAGGEAAVAGLFFSLLFAHHGEPGWAAINLFLAASALGFLVHNWPPAKVFMGDSGSAFFGAFFGMQSVVAALTTRVPFPVLVLPFANFILDTSFTLIRRAIRREKWYQAHRSHLYQRLHRTGMSQRKVTVLELCCAALSCLLAAVYSNLDPAWRFAAFGAVALSFIALCAFVAFRERETRLRA